jgi:uncharacterized membrane protein
MRTERGLDRLVFFTDAVTAIAITLLILPLVDAVTSDTAKSASVEQFIGSHLGQLATFALSFVVIARLWLAHHSLFEHVRSYSPQLVFLDLFWAFTIVLLPLPTALIAQFRTDTVTTGFYIGTMTLSSVALSAMAVIVHKNPELELKDNPLTGDKVFASIATTVEFALALILGVTVPAINFSALLILLLGIPLEAIMTRRRANRAARAN